MHAGVLALTLLHILPHAGKTTNIPEGTAIIHSAVPLMTSEELSPQLCTVWGALFVAGGWTEMAGERSGGVGNKGTPIRLLNTQRVGSRFTISNQLDKKSGFRARGGGWEDSGCRVRGYQGIQIITLQEGKSKPCYKRVWSPVGGTTCLQNKLSRAWPCCTLHPLNHSASIKTTKSVQIQHVRHNACKWTVRWRLTYHQYFGWG